MSLLTNLKRTQSHFKSVSNSPIYLAVLVVSLCLASCSTDTDLGNSQIVEQTDTNSKITSVYAPPIPKWTYVFINHYIKHNEDRFREVDGHRVMYLMDTTTRHNRHYVVSKIGFNNKLRFRTTQLLYFDVESKEMFELNMLLDSLIPWEKFDVLDRKTEAIPPNGIYQLDAAFAEWDGKSMGVKFSVIIQDGMASVIYQGVGDLTANEGEVIDVGQIMKHKSGVWIIGDELSDRELDEIGGCSGGPAIIDFQKGLFWLC